jgi:hypothetical protein
MNLPLTLALLGFGVALAVLSGWMNARPRVLGKPKMMPWPILMLFGAAWSIMMIVHLLSLFGAQTGAGRPF